MVAEGFVLALSEEDQKRLESYLRDRNFSFREVRNAVFGAAREGLSVTLYKSGKLVVQGRESSRFRETILNTVFGPRAPQRERIGTDESGKGDYFGPLVVAAVFVDGDRAERLSRSDVRDSKQLTDNSIEEAAEVVRKVCPNAVVAIGPARYNQLMEKMGNLNRLLAWGHARAIENVLEQVDCGFVITDKFGDEKFVENALLAKGRTVNLSQRTKAEDDLAVAAASILARARFVEAVSHLSDQYGRELPKGASKRVEAVARELVAERGPKVLHQVAKVHFKTTRTVLNTRLL